MKNYQILFELYHKLSDGGAHKFCTLGDVSRTQPQSRQVRAYLNTELPKYVKAMALISETQMGSIISKLFKELQASPYPIRIFNNVDEARLWLLNLV